jgi:putative heme iron utilization protein
MGNVGLVPEPEVAEARKLYLDRYANSKYWVDFEDFAFWRMEPVDVYYIGGFGVMGWLAAGEYESARPDPLANSAARIIEHVNADHVDALILLAREFGGIEAQEAAMTSVDRLGFHVRLKTAEGMRGARIAFLREVGSAQQTREVLVEMTRQAREKGRV